MKAPPPFSAFALRRPRAFSLSEMLVAVALVALVFALLLPVSGHAMRKVRETRCVGQLRELGVALLLYAGEHRMQLPPGNEDGVEWFKLNLSWLGRYLPDARPLRCPSDPTLSPVADYRYYYSYTWNTHWLMAYVGGSPAHGRAPAIVSQARRKILFADALTHGEAPQVIPKYPPGLTAANAAQRLSARHRVGLNALWGDGRVEWMRREEALDPQWLNTQVTP